MTVRLDWDVIRLEGPCRVEEAERLAALLGEAVRTVDLAACEGLHAAVAQALLAFGPPLVGQPADPFLRDRLGPALEAAITRRTAATSRPRGVMEEEPSPGDREGGEGARV
jgi:hypothetical protein